MSHLDEAEFKSDKVFYVPVYKGDGVSIVYSFRPARYKISDSGGVLYAVTRSEELYILRRDSWFYTKKEAEQYAQGFYEQLQRPLMPKRFKKTKIVHKWWSRRWP